jgi:hypothetical protein
MSEYISNKKSTTTCSVAWRRGLASTHLVKKYVQTKIYLFFLDIGVIDPTKYRAHFSKGSMTT